MAEETYTVDRDERGRFTNPSKPLFPHKVERAAVKAAGLVERSAEKRRQNRGRIFQTGFFTPAKFAKDARKTMQRALPGSTPRLRREVMKTVRGRGKYGPHYPNRYEVGQESSKGFNRMKRMK